jgi:hypothetical protein
MPSTRASIVSTPATGAATTTGKLSNESSYEARSTGVWGGVSVWWVVEEAEKERGGTEEPTAQLEDLAEGLVLDLVRA